MQPAVYTPQPLAPTAQAPAPVVLPAAPLTVAYRPGPDGQMIAEYVPLHALASIPQPVTVAPTVEPAPVPQVVRTGLDPVAQRLVGAGVLAAGTGFGIGEVVSALAGAGSSLLLIAAAAVAWKVMPSGARTVINDNRRIEHRTEARGVFARARSRVDHNRVTGGR